MASAKSKANPYQWSDGTWHSITQAAHSANVNKQAQQRTALNTPPPGTYDPALDAQQRASGRGLSDLVEDIGADTGTQRVRAFDDYNTANAQLGQTYGRGEEDYATGVARTEQGYGRTLSDLLTQRAQTSEDYGSNIKALDRNYATLGNNQGQAARAAGAMTGSGAQLQAARKREANEAIDRAPIDTAFNRAQTASQQAESRLGEDKANTLQDLLTSIGRSRQDLSAQGQQLDTTYTRQGQDWTTQLERAGRENQQYGLDVGESRIAQATQQGWAPGSLTTTKPKKKPKVKTYTTGVTTP